MKNEFIVIKKDGKLVNPQEYIRSEECSEEFRIFLQREVFKKACRSKQRGLSYLGIAQRMGFGWEDNADSGFVQYDYKADLIVRLVKDYARILVRRIGFPIYEVRGSNIFDMSYPVVKSYAHLYGDRLFQFKSGNKDVVMSYDASYPQFNLAGKYNISSKHLPFAHFSISDCYRHEQRGECMLLYRLRRFFMPDLHPYFKDIDEAFKWYPRIEEQIMNGASEVRREYQVIAEVGSEDNWKDYRDKIINIAVNAKKDILVEVKKDMKERYWIINVDYKIIDKLGQSREIACIQIDVGNAKRLDIKYSDKSGKSEYPIIIHSAIPGGIERYIYMIFDDYEKCFPLWLFPIQIRLIPLGRRHLDYCKKIVQKNRNLPIRFDIDDRDEGVSKRVKRGKEECIPYLFVIGEKERQNKGNISKLNKAIELIRSSSKDRPFIQRGWPLCVSKRVG